MAERRLQSAASSGLLPGPRHDRAAEAGHRRPAARRRPSLVKDGAVTTSNFQFLIPNSQLPTPQRPEGAIWELAVVELGVERFQPAGSRHADRGLRPYSGAGAPRV